jgi:hypothetical protein
VSDDFGFEALGDRQQLGLGVDGQDDDPDLDARRGSRRRVTGGVGELGSNDPERKVVSDYQVAVGAALRCPAVLGGGVTVKLVGS